MRKPSTPENKLSPDASRQAMRFILHGRVQGVGFRPYVCRLAHQLGLGGWVRHVGGTLEIHVEGATHTIKTFERMLLNQAPPAARAQLSTRSNVEPEYRDGFEILPSHDADPSRVHVPPDYFTCQDCLRELRDPMNRRYRYPFINCTQCGPRYSLIRELPYDRTNTSMTDFIPCRECREEYENPLDRRYHAEPIACPTCGPSLRYTAAAGNHVHESTPALQEAVIALRMGKIIAVRGHGGYHLMCDAGNDIAVARLRAKKTRPHKPLAVMIPVRGLDELEGVRSVVELTPEHASWLRDPARPIVLADKKPYTRLSLRLAPGLREIGVMLPGSPLHHLLLDEFGGPLAITSGNISGEPVLTDIEEANEQLDHVAEGFLHHDRPIERPADDSVYRIIAGFARPLRYGHGNAPLELALPFSLIDPILAVGGHKRDTIALAWDDRIVVSPHIGDLDAPRSLAVFEQTVTGLQQLYGVRARSIVCDGHPVYVTSRWSRRTGLPVMSVLHHHAHASALAGEHPDVTNWVVFTWDGAGYGADGSLWGGETMLGGPGHWKRAGSFRPFYVPGGEKVWREPWRSALSLCWEAGMEWKQCPEDPAMAHHAWRRRLNCPQTTSAGRLFDAAAALTGLHYRSSYEGQGPMMLEAACTEDTAKAITLPLTRNRLGVWESDWAPLLPFLMNSKLTVTERADGFHASLVRVLVTQANALREEHGELTIGLTGGVFQNRILTERALTALRENGFDVRLMHQIPCNDAGISYGQIIEAQSKLA